MKNVNVSDSKFAQKHPVIATKTLLGGDPMHAESVLTDRELTIVQCIAAGKSSPEIAEELFISHHTVRQHRKNILQRTGAKNVAHLVQLAVVNGWI